MHYFPKLNIYRWQRWSEGECRQFPATPCRCSSTNKPKKDTSWKHGAKVSPNKTTRYKTHAHPARAVYLFSESLDDRILASSAIPEKHFRFPLRCSLFPFLFFCSGPAVLSDSVCSGSSRVTWAAQWECHFEQCQPVSQPDTKDQAMKNALLLVGELNFCG